MPKRSTPHCRLVTKWRLSILIAVIVVVALIAGHQPVNFKMQPEPVVDLMQLSDEQLSAHLDDSQLNSLFLTGILADNDPQLGHAIIQEGNGPQRMYGVGANILPSTTVTAVYKDHVVLDFRGHPKTLWLEFGIQDLPTTNVEIDLDKLEEMFEAHYSYEDGLYRGFRLFPGRNAQWLSNMSLLPGDLVIAINGEALDPPEVGLAHLAALRIVDEADLTIVRFDEPEIMRIKLAPAINDPQDGEIGISVDETNLRISETK